MAAAVALLLAPGLFGAVVNGVALASVHPVGPLGGTSLSDRPGSAPIQASALQYGTLTLGGKLGTLSTKLWGYNYDYGSPSNGYANGTVSQYLNQTPVHWIRLPLIDPGFKYASVWTGINAFCKWTGCHEIATVGGYGVSAATAVKEMQRAVSLGVNPDYWVFGNEPNLWGPSRTSFTGLQYAQLVQQWIIDAKAVLPNAKFLGIEITGYPPVGTQYFYNISKIDGPNISAVAIQLYPDNKNPTLSGFMDNLNSRGGMIAGVTNTRAQLKAACPSCQIPIFVNEYQGGNGFDNALAVYREGYADVPFFAASLIQGLRLGIQQFAPWTLTGSTTGIANHTMGDCDMGLIELNTSCDGRTLNPTYYLYHDIFSQLPTGNLRNVSDPLSSEVYAIQDTYQNVTRVLVVNANTTTSAPFVLGPGFPTTGTLITERMGYNYVSTPAVRSMTLTSSFVPTFNLPKMGVILLTFSPTPTVALTASPGFITLGGTISLTAVGSGFGPGTTYSYTGLPTGCASANVSTLHCKPTGLGVATVTATLKSPTGATASAKVTIIVFAILYQPAKGPYAIPADLLASHRMRAAFG